jgi:hypothetical protein
MLAFAWLDDCLMAFVKARLLDDRKTCEFLFAGNGPLEFFYPRLNLAFALGWISADVRQEMNTLREIRNDFGHFREPLTFDDKAIRDKCNSLAIPALTEQHFKDVLAGGPQARFLFSCLTLAGMFVDMADKSERPLKARPIAIRGQKGAGIAWEWLAMAATIPRNVRAAIKAQAEREKKVEKTNP